MGNGFVKRGGQKAQAAAIKIAREVGHEQNEFVKSTKKQLGIETSGTEPQPKSLIDEIITGKNVTTSVTETEHEGIHSQERKRLQELQEELKSAHESEKAKLVEWQKAQSAALTPPVDSPKTIIEPTSRPKMGMMSSIARKAKGGLELMKGKK